MIAAATYAAVILFGSVFAGLFLAGVSFAVSLSASWAIACAAFLLVCLVGYGADISARWRE